MASNDKFTQIDPADILATRNSRYGLKRFRLDRLKADIVASYGVQVPVDVSPLPKDHESGKKYELTAGFYRHQAVSELNEQGAGLSLPAIVHPVISDTERLKRQLAENMERENQSPMDKAIAMALLSEDSSVTKMDLRKIFSVPGGRKGLTMQPASNSYINMHLSFLKLDKPTKEKIHDGRISVSGAYELVKADPDRRAAILEKLEADRLAQIDKEDKEEEKLLAEEKKLASVTEKVDAVRKDFEETSKEAESATQTLEEAKAKLAESVEKTSALYKDSKKPGLSAEDRKAAEAAYKESMKASEELERDVKKIDKEASKAVEEVKKLEEKVKTAEEKASENKAKLEAARKGKAKKPTAISGRDVKDAAGKLGQPSTSPLNATEMRALIDELAMPGGADKCQAIGKEIQKAFRREQTKSEMFTALQKITGEYKPPKKK